MSRWPKFEEIILTPKENPISPAEFAWKFIPANCMYSDDGYIYYFDGRPREAWCIVDEEENE